MSVAFKALDKTLDQLQQISGELLTQSELDHQSFLQKLLSNIRTTVIPQNETKTGKIQITPNGNNIATVGIFQIKKVGSADVELVWGLQPLDGSPGE